jgi:hypothetical protein
VRWLGVDDVLEDLALSACDRETVAGRRTG